MTEFKKGDRVRLTFTGEYLEETPSVIAVTGADGNPRWFARATVEVELIEPIYVPGEVYQAADGLMWLRLRGPNIVWRPLDTNRFLPRQQDVGHDFPKRPLVKLVPEK